MSSKKIKKYGNINIPAQSLLPPDKDGYLTKQGGTIKTWKKRYFILKDKTLFYYKTPKDQVFTGRLELEATSLVKEEPQKKKTMFSITTAKRIYYMYAERPEQMKEWVDAIAKSISKMSGGKPVTPVTPPSNPTTPATPSNDNGKKPQEIIEPSADMSPRLRLGLAKGVVKFLSDDESKVLEFWQIWSESIAAKEELSSGMAIDFHVATSADMQKLTWRTSGPQNVFIQKMVDFFWNVGAPESEIDRLNDVGALINPIRIGSWIDMSGKGGMDGGWYFPVDIPLRSAIEAADAGDAVKTFIEWSEKHNIGNVYSVGRDMGAAPPRQTEIRFKLPGTNYDEQLNIALDAYSAFGFPAIPDDALRVIRESKSTESCCLSVITSSEGFVRLGLMIPKPSTETVLNLCAIAGGNADDMSSFEAALGADGPAYAECQYLMKGFGYGVYKEGFDIVFHYAVGEERND
eukprot:TRINITY_DN62681_c0_g1_i1.p1 TRINITY_DN62681_c0_g1~~TRINITY_DN62681_c0_g1_i1.p1  ORF type:complete len:461 (-),score=166.48 TRINITY_DN62681_c0_g1_i1:165-1547(-)